MQSIESQRDEVQRVFGERSDVEIVELLQESKSAKEPGRPIFDQMMDRIKRGEAEGIIAWNPDRLARNSVDGGAVIYLLDRGIIKSLLFVSFNFENSPQGKLMLAIMFGYSKYYVDALSVAVSTGNSTKVKNGWRPNQAPLGYKNDKETKTIVKDPVHFSLIRRMFDLMLTGAYSPKEIAIKARDEWGFVTPKKKRIGGKPLSLSTIYAILGNRFYAGVIVWKTQTYPGKHEPIVTLDEFERVQDLLGRPSRPRPREKHFAFTGMIRCGTCGFMITAEIKMDRRRVPRYTYYHCTRGHLKPSCRQPWVRTELLEREAERFLARISIPENTRQAALLTARDDNQRAVELVQAQQSSVDRAIREIASQLNELTGLRLRNLLSDDEFLMRRQQLERDRLRLTQQRSRIGGDANRIETTEDVLALRNRAMDWFRQGDSHIKKLILETVGSKHTLKDKILSIEARKPFVCESPRATYSNLLTFVDDIRNALAENPDDAALIRHNVKMLREEFEGNRDFCSAEATQ